MTPARIFYAPNEGRHARQFGTRRALSDLRTVGLASDVGLHFGSFAKQETGGSRCAGQ